MKKSLNNHNRSLHKLMLAGMRIITRVINFNNIVGCTVHKSRLVLAVGGMTLEMLQDAVRKAK